MYQYIVYLCQNCEPHQAEQDKASVSTVEANLCSHSLYLQTAGESRNQSIEGKEKWVWYVVSTGLYLKHVLIQRNSPLLPRIEKRKGLKSKFKWGLHCTWWHWKRIGGSHDKLHYHTSLCMPKFQIWLCVCVCFCFCFPIFFLSLNIWWLPNKTFN